MKSDLIPLVLAISLIASVFAGAKYLDSASRERDPSVYMIVQDPSEGGFHPREIRVKLGQPIRLKLSTEDVTHGFLLPEFNVQSDPITPGKLVTVEFVADKEGTFPFYCNVHYNVHYDEDHSPMSGEIIVAP
ncbi:MAG: cupredoxin domain-containing protein [Chloroflexi bacterium]|nr:cupredoxin domain-containing protein [Chloroflexota bacterium]